MKITCNCPNMQISSCFSVNCQRMAALNLHMLHAVKQLLASGCSSNTTTVTAEEISHTLHDHAAAIVISV